MNHLCVHGKLDLDKINEVKVINAEVVSEKYLKAKVKSIHDYKIVDTDSC